MSKGDCQPQPGAGAPSAAFSTCCCSHGQRECTFMLVLNFANFLKFNKKPQQHKFSLKCDLFIAHAATGDGRWDPVLSAYWPLCTKDSTGMLGALWSCGHLFPFVNPHVKKWLLLESSGNKVERTYSSEAGRVRVPRGQLIRQFGSGQNRQKRKRKQVGWKELF